MTERLAGQSPVVAVWVDGDYSGNYGCDLPADTPKREVALTFAYAQLGRLESELTPEQIERLTEAVWFQPLQSVIKRDLDDWAERGTQWHTEGSGKRSKPCWWIDDDVLRVGMEGS